MLGVSTAITAVSMFTGLHLVTSATARPDSGSWPEWLAAIATSLTLVFLVIGFFHERGRHNEQIDTLLRKERQAEIRKAQLVSSNVVFATPPAPFVEADIANNSGEPIQGVGARFIRASDGKELAPPIFPAGRPELTLMKGDAKPARVRYELYEPLQPGPYGYVALEWYDMAGTRWRRNGGQGPTPDSSV